MPPTLMWPISKKLHPHPIILTYSRAVLGGCSLGLGEPPLVPRIHFREKWRGYLWQGRFASFVMDEPYLLAAARYIELSLVPGLVSDARDWPWSGRGRTLLGRTTCWSRLLPCLR